MNVSQELMDRIVEHSIYLHRYTESEIRAIVPLLDTMELKKLLIELDISQADTTDQADMLMLPIFTFLSARYAKVFNASNSMMSTLAQYEAQWNMELLRGVTGKAFNEPNIADIEQSIRNIPFNGMKLSEWYAALENSAKLRIQQTLRMGVLNGMNATDIINSVIGTNSLNYTDGAQIISLRGLETMIATFITHIVNQTQQWVYGSNSDKIDRVQWVSVLDSRTSAVCRARSGKIYPIDSGPRPPAHPRCRSRVVPLLKGEKPAADENYQQWLTRQTVQTQEEILGIQKAKLFRDGELSLDRFVDSDGKPYNLNQLRERDAEAFKRAGL